MELPPDLKKQASNLEEKKTEEKVTFKGEKLNEKTLSDLHEKTKKVESQNEEDFYELQEDLESQDADKTKSASMVGGTRGANQARARMNKNYKGTIKKAIRKKVQKSLKNQKKK